MNENLKKLIDNAQKIQETRGKAIRSKRTVIIKRLEVLGCGEVTIEKPLTTTLIAASERKGDNLYTLTESITYPPLGDVALQKAYGVNNKKALLKKMFTEEEIGDLLGVCGNLINANNTIENKVADIKN
ncbi:MAG: phage tail assembly chaperone [Cetobacterium sp.]